MMGNRKGFSTVFFAMTTLLICCNPASAFVNQTSNQATSKYQPLFFHFIVSEREIPLRVMFLFLS
jgi:hypothetical protein